MTSLIKNRETSMADYISTIADEYLEELAKFQDQRVVDLLRRNNIRADLSNVNVLRKTLEGAGYMLVDTQEGDPHTGRTHTVRLVKIIDQTSYKINPPKIIATPPVSEGEE